jgi:hypothetical protein
LDSSGGFAGWPSDKDSEFEGQEERKPTFSHRGRSFYVDRLLHKARSVSDSTLPAVVNPASWIVALNERRNAVIDTRQMTPAQIRRVAMDAVVREVGVVGLVRLLRDEMPGSGDYSVDREKWLPAFGSVEALMNAIAKEGAPAADTAPLKEMRP